MIGGQFTIDAVTLFMFHTVNWREFALLGRSPSTNEENESRARADARDARGDSHILELSHKAEANSQSALSNRQVRYLIYPI